LELIRKAAAGRNGQFEEKLVRAHRQVDGEPIRVTYACFRLTSEPSFLRNSRLTDEKHAFLLIIESPEAIAVLRRNSESISDGIAPYVLPWTYEDLGGAFVDDSVAYERLSLRSMSLGGNIIKRRSLEADDLATTMATAGVHRAIPNNFRTRTAAGVHTVTPGSSRISRRDPRATLPDLIRWIRATGAELSRAAANYSNSFLSQFSRAVPLSDLPDGAQPNAIMFDFSQLRSNWEEDPHNYEFFLMYGPRSGHRHRMTESQIISVLDFAEGVFPIEGDEIVYTSEAGKRHFLGRIRVNKHSISVRGEFFDRLHVAIGGIEHRLTAYANAEAGFVITFTNPEFAYSERQLFRDSALVGSIDTLLRIFEPRPELLNVADEKDVRDDGFGRDGIFSFVETALFPDSSVLICDDLGDEWADYVAVDVIETPSRLTFVHCKHGDLTSSASALHVPIGQALKNLSRMYRPLEAYESKLDAKWTGLYAGSFPRIRRGLDTEDARIALSEAIGDPNAQRKVVLVISSISLHGIREELENLKGGNGRPHVSQLLWLLATFMAACREHGVVIRIVCQP
jgi:hypothetical protein